VGAIGDGRKNTDRPVERRNKKGRVGKIWINGGTKLSPGVGRGGRQKGNRAPGTKKVEKKDRLIRREKRGGKGGALPGGFKE